MTMSGGSTRKPAGSRDLSSSTALSFLMPVALVPTVAEQPILLIYLPPHNAIKAEVLLTQNGDFTQPLVRQLFAVPNQSGLWRIVIPVESQVNAWEIATTYDWQVTLISKIPGRGQPPTVTGQLHRVAIAPEIESQLHQSSPQDRVALYRSQNLVYDACVELDGIRRHDPANAWAQTTWSTWMGDRGGEHLVTAPLI